MKYNADVQIKVLTVIDSRFSIMGFAGVERKFFEKGIRRDRKPVPIQPKCWIDVNFFVFSVFILRIAKPGIMFQVQ
tara:strand:- start:188 stop:415 length:228 start_codon:yes stop_codon:yes gene_type:complete